MSTGDVIPEKSDVRISLSAPTCWVYMPGIDIGDGVFPKREHEVRYLCRVRMNFGHPGNSTLQGRFGPAMELGIHETSSGTIRPVLCCSSKYLSA